jgi:hypothetical protein
MTDGRSSLRCRYMVNQLYFLCSLGGQGDSNSSKRLRWRSIAHWSQLQGCLHPNSCALEKTLRTVWVAKMHLRRGSPGVSPPLAPSATICIVRELHDLSTFPALHNLVFDFVIFSPQRRPECPW